jgi:hypothetical protein
MDETGTIYTPNLVEFAVAEPAPPDDTCRTCRFWERYNSGEWFGYCNNGNDPQPFSSGNSMIYYPETFGCRFHRPKEAG